MKQFLALTALVLLLATAPSNACTNFILTKGATTDGSVMVTYAADSHCLYGELYKYTPGKYKAGAMIPIYEWDTGRYLTDIPQSPVTYSTVGNINEHQVIIGETTYGGRHECADSTGLMDYGSMIYLGLQRAKTAREAIAVMVDLANTYGYASEGESFSVADKNEAWIFEVIGKGCKIVDGKNVNRGIVWVAYRIPDGMISAHANQARITTIDFDDKDNCLYSADVVDFARQMGWFEGEDKDFSFSDTYAPLDFGAMRGCEARVWSFFRRFAPDMDRYQDYAMGYNASNRMPLWVEPSAKISPKQVFDAMRDHYEGTPMDMRTDIGGGGENAPYRWRPMNFEVDGVKYVNERATATQQTGFWFAAQARSYLPDPIGGIIWFGTDDAATSPLTPIYCGVQSTPECLKVGNGNMIEYSPTSMFWATNRLAQFAYLRYNSIEPEVRKVIDEWENARLAERNAVEEKLEFMSRSKMIKEATKYSTEQAQTLFDKWQKLENHLLVKYIDGNVKHEDENGFKDNGHSKVIPAFPAQPGYNEKWKRAVANDHGTTIRIPN